MERTPANILRHVNFENISDFDLGTLYPLKVEQIYEPEKRKGGIIVENVDQLIDKLRNEAKII